MHSIKIQIKFHWKLETQFGFEKKTIKFIYLSTSSLMLFNLQWKTREVDSKKTEEAISCGLNVPAHIFYEISFHICIGYVCIVKKWIFATSRPIEWKTKEFKEGIRLVFWYDSLTIFLLGMQDNHRLCYSMLQPKWRHTKQTE